MSPPSTEGLPLEAEHESRDYTRFISDQNDTAVATRRDTHQIPLQGGLSLPSYSAE